ARPDLRQQSRSRASDVRPGSRAPRFWTGVTPRGVVRHSLRQTRGGAPTNRRIPGRSLRGSAAEDDQVVAVHDLTLVRRTELAGEVTGGPSQEPRQLGRVV